MALCFKTSGAGNDFLALVEPAAPPTAEAIRAWCRRGLGLGADGLLVLRRRPGAAGPVPTVELDYFNADGGGADLCLNGTRCAARLAFHLGWADDAVVLATGAGPVDARRAGEDRVALTLARPGAPEPVTLSAAGRRVAGHRVAVGVPHLVVEWPDGLESAPLPTLGAALRSHPDLGPAGANVDFVVFAGRDRIELRTWERGVEAETLACGTGVLAAAAVGVALARVALPAGVLTAGGCELAVAEAAGAPGRWSLTGDARLLARGEILPGAERLPARPRWSRP